jgi:hypothetical protein
LSGQAPPAEVADDENRTKQLLGSPFKFSRHGESGLAFSEVCPASPETCGRHRRHSFDVH